MAVLAFFALLGLAVPAAGQPKPATNGAVREVVADASGYGGPVNLPVGGSKILRFEQPIGRVLLGEPKVADVVPLSERTLYVLGKAAGITNLTVMRSGSSVPIATMDVHVGFDTDSLAHALSDLMPGEPIQVSTRGEKLVLSGLVSSSAVAARAGALAESYAPEKVINLMSIRGAEQVMLSVKVSEVQRSALKQLGLNLLTAAFSDVADVNVDTPALSRDVVLNLFGAGMIGNNITYQALFDALERKGYATTLAEPKLIALSGETAVFFAGGEFPIPVPQAGSGGVLQVTIEYKPYGVQVAFTPTVHGDSINLVVAPEVSALDQQNSVVVSGFRIPGLTSRRARTTVELKNGQSFAIAGLIKREFSNNLRGIPGASSIPILGALFRSTGYQNNETEVVIIVTAHLAKPSDRRELLVPTDISAAPSEVEMLTHPRLDTPVTRPPGGPR